MQPFWNLSRMFLKPVKRRFFFFLIFQTPEPLVSQRESQGQRVALRNILCDLRTWHEKHAFHFINHPQVISLLSFSVDYKDHTTTTATTFDYCWKWRSGKWMLNGIMSLFTRAMTSSLTFLWGSQSYTGSRNWQAVIKTLRTPALALNLNPNQCLKDSVLSLVL